MKAAWLSKTVLFNVLSLALVVLGQPTFTGLLPLSALPYVASAVPLINMVLRFVTVQPISFMFAKEK